MAMKEPRWHVRPGSVWRTMPPSTTEEVHSLLLEAFFLDSAGSLVFSLYDISKPIPHCHFTNKTPGLDLKAELSMAHSMYQVRFLADKFIWFSLSLFVNTEASLAHTNTLKLSIILLHLVQKKENQPTSQDLTKGKREKIVRRDLKMSRKPTAAGIKSEIRYPHI
jgi:hypothetical protein